MTRRLPADHIRPTLVTLAVAAVATVVAHWAHRYTWLRIGTLTFDCCPHEVGE